MAINKKLVFSTLTLLLVITAAWYFFLQNDEEIRTVTPSQPTNLADITIVAFGDSLTAGYGLPASESYPAQLETLLQEAGWSVRVINAGVSGETTRGNQERSSFIRSQNPDIVLLGIGGNDALRMLPLEETKKNISATIETLRAGENPPIVLLLTMQAPLSAGSAYKQEFDNLYTELALIHNINTAPFITPEVFFDNSKKLPDGIHLNKEGYGIIAKEYILPVLTPILERLSE